MAPRTDVGAKPFVGELVASTFDAQGGEVGIWQSAFEFVTPAEAAPAAERSPRCAAKPAPTPATVAGRGTPSPGFRDRAEGLSFRLDRSWPAQYGASITRLYATESKLLAATSKPEAQTGRRGVKRGTRSASQPNNLPSSDERGGVRVARTQPFSPGFHAPTAGSVRISGVRKDSKKRTGDDGTRVESAPIGEAARQAAQRSKKPARAATKTKAARVPRPGRANI